MSRPLKRAATDQPGPRLVAPHENAAPMRPAPPHPITPHEDTSAIKHNQKIQTATY